MYLDGEKGDWLHNLMFLIQRNNKNAYDNMSFMLQENLSSILCILDKKFYLCTWQVKVHWRDIKTFLNYIYLIFIYSIYLTDLVCGNQGMRDQVLALK